MEGPESERLATRVLVIAEVRLYREGLAQVLAERADLRVVATARDVLEALELFPQNRVEVDRMRSSRRRDGRIKAR